MEQHPVPQHIASFEFKLFGNLTVRQFVTLIIPLSFAALIYFSNLAAIIRLPTTAFLVLFGLFVALIPVGGRPFDKWAVAFIRAVLSPTQRLWVKEEKLPEFLNVVVASSPVQQEVPESVTLQGRERLFAYLRSLPKGKFTPMDVKEQVALQRLNLEASEGPVPSGQLPPPLIFPTSHADLGSTSLYFGKTAPTPKPYQTLFYASDSLPQVTAVTLPSMAQLQPMPEGLTPRIAPHAKPFVLVGLEKKLTPYQSQKETRPVELVKVPIAHLASETNFTIENIIPIRTPDRQLKFFHGVGKTRVRKLHFGPPENFDLSKLPIRGEARFEISESLKKHFQQQEEFSLRLAEAFSRTKPKAVTLPKGAKKPKAVSTPKQTRAIPKPTVNLKTPWDVTLKPKQKHLTDSKVSVRAQKTVAKVDSGIIARAQIIPLTHKPNVISGVVEDITGAPLEGAILIVRDGQGIPVRAVKTNKLGQFLSATSLVNGTYSIEIESPLASFEAISINLNGQVLSPMEIKAKAESDSATGGENG